MNAVADRLADFLVFLATLDGPVFAGLLVLIFAGLLALPSVLVRLGGSELGESLSERHDRLDYEANVAAFERLGREALR